MAEYTVKVRQVGETEVSLYVWFTCGYWRAYVKKSRKFPDGKEVWATEEIGKVGLAGIDGLPCRYDEEETYQWLMVNCPEVIDGFQKEEEQFEKADAYQYYLQKVKNKIFSLGGFDYSFRFERRDEFEAVLEGYVLRQKGPLSWKSWSFFHPYSNNWEDVKRVFEDLEAAEDPTDYFFRTLKQYHQRKGALGIKRLYHY
jgi:hypothetical protein